MRLESKDEEGKGSGYTHGCRSESVAVRSAQRTVVYAGTRISGESGVWIAFRGRQRATKAL